MFDMPRAEMLLDASAGSFEEPGQKTALPGRWSARRRPVIRTELLAAALAAGLAATPALAAEAPRTVPASAVGSWVYDANGNSLGRLRSLTDHGHKAIVMVGRDPVSIPSDLLQITKGRLTANPDGAVALLRVPPADIAG